MNYVIKSEREGWYLAGFQNSSRIPRYGKIHQAKVYSTKEEAQEDLQQLVPCGQRIVALTKIGNCNEESSKNFRKIDKMILTGRKNHRTSDLSY